MSLLDPSDLLDFSWGELDDSDLSFDVGMLEMEGFVPMASPVLSPITSVHSHASFNSSCASTSIDSSSSDDGVIFSPPMGYWVTVDRSYQHPAHSHVTYPLYPRNMMAMDISNYDQTNAPNNITSFNNNPTPIIKQESSPPQSTYSLRQNSVDRQRRLQQQQQQQQHIHTTELASIVEELQGYINSPTDPVGKVCSYIILLFLC
jgi:hypothetical protein